jgi:hypothetical protein
VQKIWVQVGFKANLQGNPEREFLSEIRAEFSAPIFFVPFQP